MLSHLYIENVAVIEQTGIDFDLGLNVLTGETGAGKSIVIDAINAILGQRVSKDIIRTGESSAFISATFNNVSKRTLKKIYDYGYKIDDDGVLIIQREISDKNKGSIKINGRPATLSILKDIGSELINIHGQHENYELLSPDLHIKYIDSVGSLDEMLVDYRTVYNKLCQVSAELKSLDLDEAQKARRIDFLNYEIDELEKANLKEGEFEELNELKNRYINDEKIRTSINGAQLAIDGDEDVPGALSGLNDAVRFLEGIRDYIPSLDPINTRLQNAIYEIQDCSEEINSLYTESSEFDNINDIEERLDLLYRLGRKYGETIKQMLEYLERSRDELRGIELLDDKKENLKNEYNKLKENATLIAERLSIKRKETSDKFINMVKRELVFLDMPFIDIKVLQEKCELNGFGCDKIEFLISTNPGEPAKPIAKIASGGELSRIMLAIKNVLADKDDIDTLIFDEVDTGISGGAAQKVGMKLREVSNSRQVICVTHLAQIACVASQHYLIEKKVLKNRTFTDIKKLSYDERKHEIARIIAGSNPTELTLNNADEMLKAGLGVRQ